MAASARLPPAAAIAVVVVGLAGWAALPAIKIETDPAQLVPAEDSALAQAEQVRKEVGLAGEIDLVVQGRDAASTDAVKWLDQASRRVARESGGDLKAVESLPIFLAGFNHGTLTDASRTALIFDRVPSYFTGAGDDSQPGPALSIFRWTHGTS